MNGHRAALIATCAIAALVAFALVAAAQGGSPFPGDQSGSGTTAGLSANAGTVAFADDFRDRSSGWTTQTLASGTTFSYTPDGYVIAAHQNLHHFASAPFTEAISRIGVSLTATQSKNAPLGAGFGVTCRRIAAQFSANQINRYEFLVIGRRWFIERRSGPLSTSKAPDLLKEGSSPAATGATPLTVEGICSSSPGGDATQLALFINGTNVGEILDRASLSSSTGWLSSILVASSDVAPATVTVSHFEVRDLSKGP